MSPSAPAPRDPAPASAPQQPGRRGKPASSGTRPSCRHTPRGAHSLPSHSSVPRAVRKVPRVENLCASSPPGPHTSCPRSREGGGAGGGAALTHMSHTRSVSISPIAYFKTGTPIRCWRRTAHAARLRRGPAGRRPTSAAPARRRSNVGSAGDAAGGAGWRDGAAGTVRSCAASAVDRRLKVSAGGGPVESSAANAVAAGSFGLPSGDGRICSLRRGAGAAAALRLVP